MSEKTNPSANKVPERFRASSQLRSRYGGASSTKSASDGPERSLPRALLLISMGLVLALAAAVADDYLHRGIETSANPPYVIQVSGRDLATNVDLRAFPSVQIETIAGTLRANGFHYIRHPFPWNEIEPNRGEFNWEKFDAIVTSLDDAGLQIVAVLYGTPQWARTPDQLDALDAPPNDPKDFGDFVTAFAGRYGQYINYYQIGDQPNNPNHWGDRVATADEYLEVLAPAFNAVRTADPDAAVILSEFDPDGGGALGSDLQFLRSIYDANGAPFFDVVSASVSGGKTSPFNRRVNVDRQNMSRAILFREMMREVGDEQKPIWFTHYGWDAAIDVSKAQQADYLVEGIQRIRREWPWAGPVFQWGLQAASLPPDQAGYALLNPDGTASVGFLAITDLANSGFSDVAPTGFVPTDSGPVTLEGAWADQHLNGRVFETTSEVGATVRIRFRGTGLVGFLRISPDAGLIHATIDGKPLPGWPIEDDAAKIDLSFYQADDVSITLADDLDEGMHEVSLTLASEGNITFGGAVVSRNPPLRWPIVVALVSAIFLLVFAIREIMLSVGELSGLMSPEKETGGGPRLPTLPDWRPSMRT